MNGLLLKDFLLMANQKSYFLFIVTLGIIISIALGSATFVVGYIILVFGLFALNTISYDEMDNGYAFLFTLPISRADYVKEKYVYGILSSFLATFFAIVIGIGANLFMTHMEITDIILTGIFSFLTVLIFLAINIPVRFRFSSDKARFVVISIMGIFLGTIVYLGSSGILSGNEVTIALSILSGLTVTLRVLVAFVVIFLMLTISYFISVYIMRKKDF